MLDLSTGKNDHFTFLKDLRLLEFSNNLIAAIVVSTNFFRSRDINIKKVLW